MPENALTALTQVATVGAMTLVTAMVEDLWREVRERVAALLSRGDRGQAALPRQLLEESRWRIASAPPELRPALRVAEQDRWAAALRLAMVLDQRLALELAVLADDVAIRVAAPPATEAAEATANAKTTANAKAAAGATDAQPPTDTLAAAGIGPAAAGTVAGAVTRS